MHGQCTKCGQSKPSSQFPTFLKNGKHYHRKECQDCRTAQSLLTYHRKHPAKPPVTEKACLGCKIVLPLEEFPRFGKKQCRFSYCRPCTRQRVNEYRNTPKGRKMKKAARLKSEYGMTMAEYDAMFQAQNGLCAICGKPESLLNRQGLIRDLVVDHCHTTGKVRKLLCNNCNNGLGYFKENPATILAAIAYIEKHRDAILS